MFAGIQLRFIRLGVPIFAVVSVMMGQSGDRVEQPVITTIEEFWSTEWALKSAGAPYRYEFDVLYYDPLWQILHVSDGDWVEFVTTHTTLSIKSGQRIAVTGTTQAPEGEFGIQGATIEVIGKSNHPVLSVNLAEIDHQGTLNEAVEIRGLVSGQSFDGESHMRLDVASDGYQVQVWIPVDPTQPVPQWAGSVVCVRGVYGPKFEPSGELRSVEVFCPSVEEVRFESHVSDAPEFEIPATKVENLGDAPAKQLVRVVGEVVGGVTGSTLYLRDESGQVSVDLAQEEFWKLGDTVEVVGYPEIVGIGRSLKRVWVRTANSALAMEFGERPNRLMHRVAASVRELTPTEVAGGADVRLEGVVTWSNPRSMVFFMQDSTGGLRVIRPNADELPPLLGAHVRVEGSTSAGGFAPQIKAKVVHEIGEIGLPTAKKISLEQALTGIEEAQWVEISGYVFGVRREAGWIRVDLSTNAGPMSVRLPGGAEVGDLEGMVAVFEGVVTAVTNEKQKLVGIDLWVPDREHVEIFEDEVSDVFALPKIGLDEVGLFSASLTPYRRIKVEGTVLHWSSQGRILVEDEASALMILTRQDDPLRRGDKIEVAGFYGRQGGRAVMREAEFRKIGIGELSSPSQVDPSVGVQMEFDGHLVSLEGEVIEGFQLGGEIRAAVQSGRTVFEIRAEENRGKSPMRLPAAGSRVKVSGVYVVDFNDRSEPVGFHVLLGETDQLEVLRPPQWWTPRRVLAGALMLVVSIGATLFWVRSLRVRVALQTRQIEEQMLRSTQLEADLNRAARLESLGTLAAGIAQDFSMLLASVHERIATVAKQPSLPVKVRAQLDEALASSLRARDLAHQLSTFSEGAEPESAGVDVGKVLEEVVTHFELPHSIVPRWQLDKSLPAILTDANMLRQVFQNLLFNSTQAMPRGGELGVYLDREKFVDDSDSMLQPGEYIRVRLRDSGEGIAEKNIGRVFDPYFTTRPGAQGLGLAVVYSLVRRLQGKVIIESTPMVGTTVTVWLPCEEVKST